MEPKKEKLSGGLFASPDQWKKEIQALQHQKQINPSLDPELITLLICTLTSGAVGEDYEGILKDRKQREAFLSLALAFLTKALH